MPFDIQAPLVSLAETAHTSLIAKFHEWGHHPSADQWEAILDLLDHLETAANHDLEQAVYVSAIPAGCGKSASLVAFTKALASSPAYAGTGVLIACNRVTEVHDMATALQSHRGKLCVIVGRGNPATLALGDHSEAGEAQIVVCTQASLKETMKATRFFERAQRFHFRGARRDVVCWDEAVAFNRPVTLDADTVGDLAKLMRRQAPEAAVAVKEWSLAIDRHPTGPCAVPDFKALGVCFHRLEEDAADRDDLVAQVKALRVSSGGTGWVLKGNLGSSLVSHVPELPIGLLPLIVTDASAARGVAHASYDQMGRTRRIIRLREAAKTYANMALKIVPTAASRSTYRDKTSPKGKELIEMAVRAIKRAAPEKVLVISYKSWLVMKGVEERTISAAIDARLTDEEKARVSHLTYGSHTATNVFKDCRHVILMGLNFLPSAASYAASGAALQKPMRSADPADHPTEHQVEEMRVGMLRDATVQAVLRGNARLGLSGDCGPCEVIIPQTRQTGLTEADYRGMFPGVTLTEDRSLMPVKPLRGRLKDLSAIVARRLAAGDVEMPNPSLCAELGMARQDFAALVKKPEWGVWVAAMGLNPGLLRGRVMGLRRLA